MATAPKIIFNLLYNTPISIPPKERDKKFTTIYQIPLDSPLMILTDIIMRIMQVASLINDSPSIKDLNFYGAPTSLSRATTAAVSVHESMDPIKKALILV